MQDAYAILILFSVLFLIFGVIMILTWIKFKHFYIFYKLSSAFLLLVPTLLIIGTIMASDTMIATAFIFPFPLFLFFFSAETLCQYTKCTHKITAIYTSPNSAGGGFVYPIFSYQYGGKDFLCQSCRAYYSRRRFKKIFEKDNTYDIYVNPQFPERCADKRTFPLYMVFSLIVSVLLLLIPLLMILT